MPINPADQQRAMFTVQKGPNISSNRTSISVDASSIETSEPLSEISNPEEKAEFQARQTKIIALLGLDTLSTAEGFEDFFNFFTLKSIESELCQKVVSEHLSSLAPDPELLVDFSPEAASIGSSHIQRLSQRAVGNAIYKIHKILEKSTEGITSINDSSSISRKALWFFERAHNKEPRQKSQFKFYFNEIHRMGYSASFQERIERFLGIKNMDTQRPSFQYLRLVIDAYGMLMPRTCPTFYSQDVERAVGGHDGQAIMPYNATVAGYDAEGSMTAEGGTLPELTINSFQTQMRIGTSNREHALLGYNTEGMPRPFQSLRDQPMSKNIAAMIYVMQRDHEMSYRITESSNDTLSKTPWWKAVRVTSPESLTISVAMASAAANAAEGNTNILHGISGRAIEYETEDRNSRVRSRWYKVCNLEATGIKHHSLDGSTERLAKIISPSQLYQRVQGTSRSLDILSDISSEQLGRAEVAKAIAAEGFGLGAGHALASPADVPYQVGHFIEQMGVRIGRMIRYAEKASPGHMDSIRNTADDEGGDAHFDLTRWKAYGGSATVPTWDYHGGEATNSQWQNEFTSNAWNKQKNEHLWEYLSPHFQNQISYLEEEYTAGSGAMHHLMAVKAHLNTFADMVSEEHYYNAGRSGVIHMDSGNGKGWQLANQRVAIGLGLVLASMKNREEKDIGKYALYNQLYSRFRFAVFTRLTGDFDGLSSGEPSLAYDIYGGVHSSEYADVDTLAGQGMNIPMSTRSPYNAEGGTTSPESSIGQSIPGDKISSIADIVSATASEVTKKAEIFGYVKSSPNHGNKFRIPTENRVRYSMGFQGERDVTDLGAFLPNDIKAVCDTLRHIGVTTSEMSSEEEGKMYAINMASGQAEEYYEMGWAQIGSLVANIISEMTSEMDNIGMLTQSGITVKGGQGLDTYITLFFEVLGMIADTLPLVVCNSQDFHDLSADRSETVLLEDVDLRNHINENNPAEATDYDTESGPNLFFSKSGVDHPAASAAKFNIHSEMLRTYRYICVASALRRDPDVRTLAFDNELQNGINPDGTPNWGRGTLDWAIGRSTSSGANTRNGFYALRAANQFNEAIEDARLDKTSDIALVLPKRLKAVLPRSTSYSGYSASQCFKVIGKYIKQGHVNHGVSQYEAKSDDAYSLTANYNAIPDTNLDMLIEAQDSYIQSCDDYFESISINPRKGSILDLYKIPGHIIYNEAARAVAHSSLEAYNACVIDRVKNVETQVSEIIDRISPNAVGDSHNFLSIRDDLAATRIRKNMNGLDSSTSDRPIRTVAKLSPRGSATSEIPGYEDGSHAFGFNASAEFSNVIKNLILAYLDNYPIEDTREAIIVAGCPAGSDAKHLGRFDGKSFIIRSHDATGEIAAPRDPYSSGITRTFSITVEKDLQTDSRFSSQFTVDRKYQMRYFLLPESFEGITSDDLFEVSDNAGWLRAIAMRAKWFRAPSPGQITGNFRTPLQTLSWLEAISPNNLHEEADDMVESFILQWVTVMLSGVFLDQDLIFDKTANVSSFDIMQPCITDLGRNNLKNQEEERERNNSQTVLGIRSQNITHLFRDNPIPFQQHNSDNMNKLTEYRYRTGFPHDDDARNLVTDTYKSRLDPETGAEILVVTPSPIKPWNVRLAASLTNAYVYKARIITSMMAATPSYDYMMFMRLKKSDFEGTQISPVDIISYRVEITNGKPNNPAEG